jgi:amino acid transporter
MHLKRFFYLAGMILLSFFGILAFIFLVMVLMRFLMGAMDQIPWMLYAYMSVMLMLPVILFNTAFAIFFKRSASHPRKWVKWFSRIAFVCASFSWLGIFAWDLRYFIQTGYGDINRYTAYSLTTLVPTVFFIFFMGVLQALTMQPELDWMERRRLREEGSKSL